MKDNLTFLPEITSRVTYKTSKSKLSEMKNQSETVLRSKKGLDNTKEKVENRFKQKYKALLRNILTNGSVKREKVNMDISNKVLSKLGIDKQFKLSPIKKEVERHGVNTETIKDNKNEKKLKVQEEHKLPQIHAQNHYKVQEPKTKDTKRNDNPSTRSNGTDYEIWKRRHKIPETTKVFIVDNSYGDIKRALKKRGWIENTKQNSQYFDFKWTITNKEIDYDNLRYRQIANHFENMKVLTTKVGLCRSLRNLIWCSNVDINAFYPRCFDLSDPNDTERFVEEFKSLKAESVLKRFVNQSDEVNDEELAAAMDICERKVKSLDDILDDSKVRSEYVTAQEWVALENKEVIKKKKLSKTTTIHNTSIDEVKALLLKLQQKFSQYKTNGYRNMWILKPAMLSRGRGIRIFNSLKEIIRYSKTTSCVVQKYIENPMLVKGRKFDIRQWVLVTSFCPLTIWFYKECYIRFGGEDYKIEDIDNKYMHLTNNSVTKNCEEKDEIKGNMWQQSDLEDYLKVAFYSFL